MPHANEAVVLQEIVLSPAVVPFGFGRREKGTPRPTELEPSMSTLTTTRHGFFQDHQGRSLADLLNKWKQPFDALRDFFLRGGRQLSIQKAAAAKVIKAGIRTRTATRTAATSPTEALLDKVDDPILANLWQQIRPLHVGQLPDRQRIIADLAGFAEVLRPRLNGMQAPQLCRLIEAYAVKRRSSQRFSRNLLRSDVNARQRRVVADVRPEVRLGHRIIDVASVAV